MLRTTPRDLLGRTERQGSGPFVGREAPAEPYESVVRPLFELARAGQVARRLVDFDYPVRGRRTIEMLMQPALDEEGHQDRRALLRHRRDGSRNVTP